MLEERVNKKENKSPLEIRLDPSVTEETTSRRCKPRIIEHRIIKHAPGKKSEETIEENQDMADEIPQASLTSMPEEAPGETKGERSYTLETPNEIPWQLTVSLFPESDQLSETSVVSMVV